MTYIFFLNCSLFFCSSLQFDDALRFETFSFNIISNNLWLRQLKLWSIRFSLEIRLPWRVFLDIFSQAVFKEVSFVKKTFMKKTFVKKGHEKNPFVWNQSFFLWLLIFCAFLRFEDRIKRFSCLFLQVKTHQFLPTFQSLIAIFCTRNTSNSHGKRNLYQETDKRSCT